MASQLTLAALVKGDAYGLLHPLSGLTPGTTMVSATCVVKQSAGAPSPVAGIAKKTLTTTLSANGQVINTGGTVPANTGGFASPAIQPYVYVLFTPAETASLTGGGPDYTVIVQITDSNGNPYTSEISALPVKSGTNG